MVEETFIAPSGRDAFELSREKYGLFSDLKLLRATQQRDEEGRLRAHIVVAVPQEDYLASIGIDEEEELVGEIQQLRDQMERLRKVVDPAPHPTEQEPFALRAVREMMMRRGLPPAWLDAVLDPIRSEDVAQERSLLVSYILEEMDETLRILPEPEGKRRLMLIGPTGVGKTTTVAKLAARYIHDPHTPRSVIVLNLDASRAGADAQMEHYARTIGFEHLHVASPEALEELWPQVEDREGVLIDTAGISPYASGPLPHYASMLTHLSDVRIECALVLAATLKYADAMSARDRCAFRPIDHVVLTKLDETSTIGDGIGFLLESRLPVSYISTGQKIPEDLYPADKEILLARFVEERHADDASS
jgi:flagellar biosynthesis protein FlhF